MFYKFYEMNHALMQPWRTMAEATSMFYRNPANPFSQTKYARTVAAWAEVFERTTRRYGKPAFNIHQTVVDDQEIAVVERVEWEKPFCKLLHFSRALKKPRHNDPKILLVAPMSGHYATLLRGTVERLIPEAEVYITDWVDARDVPVSEGAFDLSDYIDYLIEMVEHMGPDTHIIGVCQPSVPVLAAVAVMEKRKDAVSPLSMTLMGGPIDTRRNPTAVNDLAEEKDIDWFRENVIMDVPFPNPGLGRKVYPGFLQLTGFMSMNLDRHMIAQKDFFMHLVRGDGDSAEKHRDFYDEYLAVMDLTAEFYLQTIEVVFIEHSLAKGTMMHRGERVDLSAIKNVSLFTIEGENDDITGRGQTEAAQDLCSNIPPAFKQHYEQPSVGHYGVFNGSRFRKEVAPRILEFMAKSKSRKERKKPELRAVS
ncbi:polyhydroxyalkanoate depolymerase [Ahrensia marina]|uniref:Esterase n=1 Tax=Ahrensia marina TaxID=1514904 RepID=A0A0N0E888_9HYPH|nr:polyhydroxyalkanoate depolymerase [Ahrensia marina]KPB01962.1 esterase [Ahrensia marina]